MTRKMIAPKKLLTLMINPLWLERQAHESGKVTIIHIYHDDWCKCADGEKGLISCTCQVVEYDFSIMGS